MLETEKKKKWGRTLTAYVIVESFDLEATKMQLSEACG